MLMQLLERLSDIILAGLLSLVGGMATYVNQVVKGRREFVWIQFILHCFLAFIVGNLISPFIPATMEYRDGILMLAGFISPQIMALLETKAEQFFSVLLGQKIKSLDAKDEEEK